MRKIGRYQITRELGRGAMGVVYHAIDPTIGRPVAIKTLRLRDMDDGDQRRRLRERLFREARSAGALSHPGIVTIYDMDEVDGLAYIAMEFVDGETLEAILNGPHGVSKERVGEILRQAAAALDYAHRKGIIHRDIKPANVMIDLTGVVKITDFGIAKITEVEGQTLTGALIGTPNYMSPEQVQGHEIDGRTDQFALAVIAFEMLSGERPFYGEQISTVVYKIVADQPVPIQNINKTLNDGVDKVLRRGLAKKREKRFANCSAFVSGLEGALGGVKGWRVLPRKAHQNIQTVATDAPTRTVRPPRNKPRKRQPASDTDVPMKKRSGVVAFFAAFLALMALLGAVAWQAGLLEVPWMHGAEANGGRSGAASGEGAEHVMPPSTPASDEVASTNPVAPPPSEDRQSPMPAAPEGAPATVGEGKKPVSSETKVPQGTAPAAAPGATSQQIAVASDPPGALAALDGRGDATCQTPCKLNAQTGTHTVTVTKSGYQAESREVRVEHEDVEEPLLVLRSANGMLLLTSEPLGAHVWVDGKPTDFTTPVRISLPAGAHRVAIQKDGMQASEQVEIQNGTLSTLKLTVKRE